MKASDWKDVDHFIVRFFCAEDPLAAGDGALEGILELVERHLGELTPDKGRVMPQRKRRYSRAVVMKQFSTRDRTFESSEVWLSKDDDRAELWTYLSLNFVPHWGSRFVFNLDVMPFDFYRDEARAQARSQQIVTFIREMARRFPPAYAYGHSEMDESMGGKLDYKKQAPDKVEEVYWLNVYGRQMVERLGRERVLATPAAHLEELPHGGVLFLTRPTPGDFGSDEARVAQARALAHLNPELPFDRALARQRERSARVVPVERSWDPDLVGLLEFLVKRELLKDRQLETARLNAWRPPPVSEWLPLSEAPPGEGEDIQRALLADVDVDAEGLQLTHEEKVPEVKQANPESLIPLDIQFWCFNCSRFPNREEIAQQLIPMLGAYLGEMMVRHLGGRWVGRRNRDECYVALGERAWFPFRRARHYLQSQQAVLDCSLTKFYREAERYVRGRQNPT